MKQFQNQMKILIEQKVQEMVKLNNMVGSQQQAQIIQQKKLIAELEELQQMRFVQKEQSIIQLDPQQVNQSKSHDDEKLLNIIDKEVNDLDISQESLHSQQLSRDQKLRRLIWYDEFSQLFIFIKFLKYDQCQNRNGKAHQIKNNQLNLAEMAHVGEIESDNEVLDQDGDASYLRPVNKNSEVQQAEIEFIDAIRKKKVLKEDPQDDDDEDDHDFDDLLNKEKQKLLGPNSEQQTNKELLESLIRYNKYLKTNLEYKNYSNQLFVYYLVNLRNYVFIDIFILMKSANSNLPNSIQPDQNEINEYIKEYLRYSSFANTLECFEAEIKSKQVSNKMLNKQQQSKQIGDEAPRLFQLFKSDNTKTKREINLEKEQKAFNKKYQQILQAGRQIFSVSINLLQLLHSLKETAKNENLSETLENYKIQLGKYHKVIINEGKPEGTELITEQVMHEHKTKLFKNFQDKHVDGMIEVLLSLRVNALQIAPELRKNLVYELIRNDVFNIEATEKFDFVVHLLDINNQSLRHAITSLISVISSTLRGVEYLTYNGNMIIIEKIIKILKEQENGAVTQRFCLAILQKASIKDTVIPTYVHNEMIQWIILLIQKSINTKIHIFCLDFASATLANVIHTPYTLQYLEKQGKFAHQVMEQLLKFMKDQIQVSVLMHVLICLSYLSKENFAKQMEECRFVERISEFVEYYSVINTENEAAEIDKKTVLDLCAHMFHPKDTSLDNSETVELNELKTEDRIREYENEQGELIFECFQDEVS